MRAALLHGPGDLRIETLPEPEPGAGQVVLEIRSALTCATDVKSVLRGHPSIARYPSRLGHEFAGVVSRVGEGVEAFRRGDEVFCGNSAPCGACHQCARGRESLCEDLLYLLGGFADELLVPERVVERNVHRLPAGLELRLAPLAEPLACAIHAFDAADVRSGDPVAIVGGGSLGLMLCALAAAAGGRPILLDPHKERLARASDFGAVETILATRGPKDVERLRERTSGRGAELVIEAVGRPETWELAVEMAAPGGTVNLFGGCPGGTRFTVATARVHYEQVRLLGTHHHAPRYIALALEMLAAAERPWPLLCGPLIDLDQLPDALAGRLDSPVPPKYTVLSRAAR
jgi:L-iditol 2-dehydrogenase